MTEVDPLHLVPVSEIVKGPTPHERAKYDLHLYAKRLRQMADILRPIQHAMALSWMEDWRLYCWERNTQRWPDGRFYLLDRRYLHWRGHRIAFTREELSAIDGLDAWDRHAIHGDYNRTSFVPLQSEHWHYHPGRRLKQFAAIVASIYSAVEDRA